MRIERAVTTVSWIPSDSLSGMLKAGEKLRLAHHDEPPPDQIGSPAQPLLDELRDADRFRFANLLRAWVEVEDGATWRASTVAVATWDRPPSASASATWSSPRSPIRTCLRA